VINAANWGWEKTSIEGQGMIHYLLPPHLDDIMTVVLFLKGPLMEKTGGNLSKVSQQLFGKEKDIPLAAPSQVHGTRMVEALPSTSLPTRPEGDALLVRRTGVFGSLRFADCVPVVAVSDRPRPWILLVHSGLIGTARGVTGEALKETMKIVGLASLEDIHFWIGPGIGPCCYSREMDDPKTREGLKRIPRNSWRLEEGIAYFDLSCAIVTTLYDMKVPKKNITRIDQCTCCSSGGYYSYRKGDRLGKSLLLAGFREGFHKTTLWWENKI